MVAGHLQQKRGFYHIVLSYTGSDGKRKTKWKATGLPVKGNKKKAEAMLESVRKTYVPPDIGKKDALGQYRGNELFTDYMEYWLVIARTSIAETTYASYSTLYKASIKPYFEKLEVTLGGLTPKHIQDFYTEQLKRVKAATVIHYHAIIHRALKYAFKTDRIDENPAAKIDRPKMERFIGDFYDEDEMAKLFDVALGTKLELPIFFGAFYGLRRSEILGLKWDSIDFERNTISIRHTVVDCYVDGKHVLIQSDTTKTKSSMRTLPLVPVFREGLLRLKQQQAYHRKLCGRSYCKHYLEYICVNEIGELIKPNYISCTFPKMLVKNKLRRIRFHDLRHSCASLLLANGVPMKQIQEWLGHSDFSTTADTYAHLDYASKLSSADAMLGALNVPLGLPSGVDRNALPLLT